MLTYLSGEEIKPGDHVRLHGEPGRIEFVASAPSGDASLDWYLEQYPAGGAMVEAKDFGAVFLDRSAIDERLEFVERERQ